MGAAGEVRWSAEHRHRGETLRAIEPTLDEVVAAAPALASFYNDPYNRRMMANTISMSTEEVVASFADLRAGGGRPFLLYAGERLVGDGDLRHLGVSAGAAEVAVLVGDRAVQGRGLGTRFTALLHAFGFQVLGLERIYASILPGNEPSLRLFARLGHAPDASEAARAFTDEPGDVTLSVSRPIFESAARDLLEDVRLAPR
ncbi:MAG TPA: GNAT family N-acetyltransferase [Polyangia bacterium]